MIAVSQFANIGDVIDDVEKIAFSDGFQLQNQVIYLPFRNR